MFPLAFVAGSLQGHWWGFISRNYVVWPIFFLMNVFIALKGTHFWILCAFTAAGVVPCGGRKTSPRTSTIVQFIFYFWSFEISVNILRNRKLMVGLDSYSRQVFNYLDTILIYISLWIDCLFEIRKIEVCFLWLSLPGHYRVTDEALLAETTLSDPSSFLWMFSLLLKEFIFEFYLPSLQLVLCRVAAVKRLPVHQP